MESNYTAHEASGNVLDTQAPSTSFMAGVGDSSSSMPLDASATAAAKLVSSLFFHYSFEDIEPRFHECHKNEINVVLHMMTTPLGLIGALSLIRALTHSSSTMATCIAFYLLTLLPALPVGVYMVNFLMSLVLVAATRYLKLSVKSSVALIVVAYVLQDLAHRGTHEKTYQSGYSESQSGQDKFGINGHFLWSYKWLQEFVIQTYYLLPLCIDVTMKMPMFIGIFPQNFSDMIGKSMPQEFQNLRVYLAWLTPVFTIVLGSYCLDSKNSFCFFPGTPYFKRVLQCNIATDEGESRRDDMAKVRNWVLDQNPPETKSSHWWYRELTHGAKEAFDRCARASQITGMFRSLFSERHYCLDVVEGMNEVYVTGPARKDEDANSDNVFYTRHVDGPFGMIPFVSVYRCIVGMDRNKMITTHFPLAMISHNACEGDVLAFDFNREVHYIDRDDSKQADSDTFRVVLKLHYCVYPRVMAPLGWLMHAANVMYNKGFRALFLKTINPTTLYEHFLAWNVNFQTVAFDHLETFVGQRNVFYLSFLVLISFVVGQVDVGATKFPEPYPITLFGNTIKFQYDVFLYMTSFAHYFRYISTFYFREEIDFGSFKRDVLLMKTLSIAQLYLWYIYFETKGATSLMDFVAGLDYVSIGMIFIGYTISLQATAALGIDRTYFAAELGLVEPKWITAWPYSQIPHPMILSQVFALLGAYKAEKFRTAMPYLVPIHICLYLVHMLQEELGVFRRPKHVAKTTTKTKAKKA